MAATLHAATSVTTWHNDNGRTGANPNETILNTSNVNGATFGKLYSLPVDAQIYAQPLYVPSVAIPGNGTHNVLYVATENNSVYAFDADSSSTQPLWQVNLGVPVPSGENIFPYIGILSTPVIDVSRQAIYLVAQTYANSNAQFYLHSLDITTGKDRVGSPVLISAQVPGVGAGSSNGTLSLVPFQCLQRTALLELNGNIYVGIGSHADHWPYHGWMLGFDGVSLRRIALKCYSPNGYGSAIWQGGAGLSADPAGNIYVATGNGDFNPAVGDYGDSVLKLNAAGGLVMTSSFTPSIQQFLESADQDLGTGGVLVMPGSSLQIAPTVIAGGKYGQIYVLNGASLGGYNSTDQVVQEWSLGSNRLGGNVFYNNMLYIWADGQTLLRYSFNGSSFTAIPPPQNAFQSDPAYANSPAMSISANGLVPGTAILWAAHAQNGSVVDGASHPGMLHAYDAVSGEELWNSFQNSADYPGAWAKWSPPTVVNGKVYLATFDSGVAVYGLK
jgi:hypothetical protein